MKTFFTEVILLCILFPKHQVHPATLISIKKWELSLTNPTTVLSSHNFWKQKSFPNLPNNPHTHKTRIPIQKNKVFSHFKLINFDFLVLFEAIVIIEGELIKNGWTSNQRTSICLCKCLLLAYLDNDLECKPSVTSRSRSSEKSKCANRSCWEFSRPCVA